MSTEELHKVCSILDKLTLDSLTLMEEEIQMKLNVEKAMCDGEGHLAKSRYILGHNNVSSMKLPTENSNEFDSLVKVHTVEDEKAFNNKSFELEVVRKSKENSSEYQDPIHWFGYLVPQNLHYAQNMFRQALHWIVQAANVQNRLSETCKKIEQLTAYKETLKSNNKIEE